MEFREIEHGDVQRIYAFCESIRREAIKMSFADVSSHAEIEQWIESDRVHVFALFEREAVLALFKAKQGGQYRSHAAFLSAAVRKDRRGQGLVQQLGRLATPILKERGILVARAYIYSDNHASIAAALKDGFHCTGSVHMHHMDQQTGQWVDDMIFHKKL